MARDPLDDLFAELGRQRRPGVSLYETAACVLRDHECSLDAATKDALEFTGWKSVEDAGTYPVEIPVLKVLNRIKAGETFDSADLDAQERSKLATLGFLTLAAEHLLRAEGET